MKKLLLVLGLLVGGLSVANADEESGAFIGLEAGYAGYEFKVEQGENSLKKTDGGVAFGVNAGYKYFVNSWFGVRGYANFSYLTGKISAADFNNATVNNMVYAVNADALFNFYNNESVSFGAFVGLGVGGTTWETKEGGLKDTNSGLYADAKVGLRTNIAKHHGIELVAKIPFVGVKKNFDDGSGGSYKVTTKQNYQVVVGYNYTF
ncbi:hypothetical protein CCY99_00595 [Helicobacter sp. 16-1353]|uniref:outer membrane beta-barrel protein n=1 Tax=Helicobacter sp. 16-1353 TaxID=2004996 RepID=UPI000DCE516D|nr:outer membrane beta-barrel protein [Helicobacter sp. 16-1353]RAX55231.1 hypothetical protein CCY99_00595 [Helicobacter sp. 16-1353]